MNLYKTVVKSFLPEFTSKPRKSRGLTQEEMAEKLRITSRAYSDLERGVYCFSAITLLFLLLMLKDGEVKDLLDSFRKEIKNAEVA